MKLDVLSDEGGHGGTYSGETISKSSIEIGETYESLYLFELSWDSPGLDCGYFDRVHPNASRVDESSEESCFLDVILALGWFKIEICSL